MSRGYTLLEVLVVLVILTVVLSAVGPAAIRLGAEDEPTTASRELITVLRTARRTAVDQNTAVSVVVEPASARYWVVTPSNPAADPLESGVFSVGSARLVAAGERAAFSFDPRGTAHGDSLLVRADGSEVRVGVDRWTGTPYAR